MKSNSSFCRRSLLTTMALLLALLVSPLWGDGLIIIHDPPTPIPGHFAFAPLEVSYHRVEATINGLVATTTVDQAFYNPNDRVLEGTYIFPLPSGAHIDRFIMEINGKPVEAELLSADKARAIYEEIVRKMKDPALLEYVGRDAFKVRIYPIEPRSTKPIKITYTQLLKNDAGLVEYVYPLNTEKFSSSLIKDVSVKVSIAGKEALKTVYCPSHTAEIRRDGEQRAVIGWEARDVRPDSDFKVVFSRSPNPLGIELLTSRQPGEDGYFLLLASPGVVAPKRGTQPKDICFVLDTSGSMAGAKMEQAKKSLAFCLANLNADDRFEIVRFSTEAEPLFSKLTVATPENLSRANQFVDGLKPIGGTAIGEALELALELPSKTADSARPYLVIFLTDGLPTIGETDEDKLVALATRTANSTRVFTFGLGTDVNAHLLDRIATDTRGLSQYVLPKEDLELKLSAFYRKIKEPVLTHVELHFTNPAIRVTQLYPHPLPDLFNGDQLLLFGRYTGNGPAAAVIAGQFLGEKQEFAADVAFPETMDGNRFVPQLWATRRVGWLLDEIRLHGESSELKDEVTRLAREHGIVTPYTAYLIVEDEARRNVPFAQRTMQELERDKDTRARAGVAMDSLNKESQIVASRAGARAVNNATSIGDLKQQESMAAPSAGSPELAKADAPQGRNFGYRVSQNYTQQARNINGRAFYQNGTQWTDATAQNQALKQQNIRFNSEAYFALLRAHPEAAPWFALGNNVDVVLGDTLYQIRDEG